jgi:hypothetical protein
MNTLLSSRYRKPPPAYTFLCEFCDLTRTQQHQLWHALTRATWTIPVGWRQHLWLYEDTALTPMKIFVHEVCAPAHIIEVIEVLERERLLTHVIANGLEECVLNATDKHGRWCDHKSLKPGKR